MKCLQQRNSFFIKWIILTKCQMSACRKSYWAQLCQKKNRNHSSIQRIHTDELLSARVEYNWASLASWTSSTSALNNIHTDTQSRLLVYPGSLEFDDSPFYITIQIADKFKTYAAAEVQSAAKRKMLMLCWRVMKTFCHSPHNGNTTKKTVNILSHELSHVLIDHKTPEYPRLLPVLFCYLLHFPGTQNVYHMWPTAVLAWRQSGHMLLFVLGKGANMNHMKTCLKNTVCWNHFASSWTKPSISNTLKERCPFSLNSLAA